jgi:hypothetical protein
VPLSTFPLIFLRPNRVLTMGEIVTCRFLGCGILKNCAYSPIPRGTSI